MKNLLKSAIVVSAICLMPLAAQAETGERYNQQSSYIYGTSRLDAGATRDLQRALSSRGFNTGSVDGIWGRQTDRAVRDYQRSMGREPTGVLTSTDLRYLDVLAMDDGSYTYSRITPAAGDGIVTRTYTTEEGCDIIRSRNIKYGNSGYAWGSEAFLE